MTIIACSYIHWQKNERAMFLSSMNSCYWGTWPVVECEIAHSKQTVLVDQTSRTGHGGWSTWGTLTLSRTASWLCIFKITLVAEDDCCFTKERRWLHVVILAYRNCSLQATYMRDGHVDDVSLRTCIHTLLHTYIHKYSDFLVVLIIVEV